jgi:hypothetical protein
MVTWTTHGGKSRQLPYDCVQLLTQFIASKLVRILGAGSSWAKGRR